MELIKKNIHMEREKCRTLTQMTIEEDVNIKDQSKDAQRIITQKGRILLEEVHPFMDYAVIKGKLVYSLLYLGDEENVRPYLMEGAIPFEEKVHMEGVGPNDTIHVKSQLEDLSASLINSRKLSIRALVTWKLFVNEIHDEEAVVDIVMEDEIEVYKKPLQITSLCASTKDIIRMKQEIELPMGMPNIFQLIWQEIQLNGIEFRLFEDQITYQGELICFFLYEGEGEESPIHRFEVTRPFSGQIEVNGCSENRISDISYDIEHEEVEIRPDYDGEERILSMDIAVNVSIKLMETQTLPVVTDVYGIEKDIDPVLKPASCSSLLMKNTGKMKVAQTFKTDSEEASILQLCSTSACLYQENERVVEEGLELSGALSVQSIYMTKNNDIPYNSITGHIPYTYVVEIPGMQEDYTYRVDAFLEQLTASSSGGDEIEVKAVLVFHVIVYKKEEEPILSDIMIQETDVERRDKIPGMAVYIAKDNDTIWNVGKKYCIPRDTIREFNQLFQDELACGDKILLVKEMK